MSYNQISVCLIAATALLFAGAARAADPSSVNSAPSAADAPAVVGGHLPSDLPSESSSFDVAGRMANLLSTAKANGGVMRLYSQWQHGDRGALNQIFLAAEGGNTWAEELVGYMLDNGDGVKQDSKLAAAYFQRAAKDVPLARYNLGLLYYYGRGVPKDEAKAAELLKLATKSGGVDQACVLLSLYYLHHNDIDEAYKWANEGSDRGNVKSFYLLGRILYQRGQYRDARMWIEKAAAAVEPNAPAILAIMYADGKGIDRNPMMGAAWWLIYNGLNHHPGGITALGSFDLSKSDRDRAVAFANNWLANHREGRHIEYRKTILQST